MRQQRVAAAAAVLAVASVCLAGTAAFAFSPAPTPGARAPAAGGGLAVSGAQPGLGLGPSRTASTSSAIPAFVALAAVAAGAAALIVQNKGGGHGELGYHLALKLVKEKGLKVTLINDSAAKKDKPPFSNYAELEAAGVAVKWADLEKGGLAGALEGVGPCDYVFDNQNVCPGEVQSAVASWKPKAYAYVSSGGMYKPVKEGPLLETGAVKEDNAQLAIEKSAADKGLAWSAFRPQYVYGPKTNKRDYLDWFLDRIVRDLPIPLPGDGSFRTTLTNAEDVASMLASVVGKEEAAKGQVFNCATDVLISHIEVVELVAKAVGKDLQAVKTNIVFYDPAALKGKELPSKGKFPFREANFGVGVQKAKDVLGWSPAHKIEDDIAWYFEEYKRLGKDTSKVAREWDEAVINLVKSTI